MTRARLIFAVLVAAALWSPAATLAKDQTQQFFEQKLLADKRTSQDIKTLLQRGGGFVEKKVGFHDITGDKRDEAIVRVNSGGADGVVAVYVFSTANKKGGKLRAIFRSQKLMRVSTRFSKSVLSYRTARYEPGDELCCPAHLTESTLGWDKEDRRMRVVKRDTFVTPPEAQAPSAPPPPEDPN